MKVLYSWLKEYVDIDVTPKRMDYENVMKTLQTLMNELDEIFHKEKQKGGTFHWKKK